MVRTIGASIWIMVGATALAAQPQPIFRNARPVRSCESLTRVTLKDTVVDTAAVEPANGTRPAICRVTATFTHPGAGDRIQIFLGLPLTNWNGRFEGVGGGGFLGGSPYGVMGPAARGFAAGSTDTGHPGGRGSFALDSHGRLDWLLIRDNAYLGIHEMTVTGKALVKAFYGRNARYSYFNGCSTGGRQGLSEAQRYPTDYDGVLSGAPAINWPKLHAEQMWGHVVMIRLKDFVPHCKFAAAQAAAIAACDAADGVKDGVIDDPRRCDYDPRRLVGTSPAGCGPFTEADADVIRQIWQGPHRQDGSFLWYGLPRGASFSGLSATGGTPLSSRPNPITLDWWRYFLTEDPQWDWKVLTPGLYELYFDQSVEEFGAVLGTDNPDLSKFRSHGGKIVVWHGWADQLIYPEGTIDYYRRVQQQMGGAKATAEFMRLFLAPGVEHCAGGPGPQPTGQFEAVIAWVEEGKAPNELQAVRRDSSGTVIRSRPLCPYPLVARYKGKGSTDDAANFACRAK